MNIDDFIFMIVEEGAKKPFPRPSFIAMSWIAIITGYFCVLLAFYGFRSDVSDKFIQPMYFTELSAMALVVIMSALSASWLSLPDTNQKSWIIFSPFIPLIFLFGILMGDIFSTSDIAHTECLNIDHYKCAISMMLYSILPAIMMFYTMQKAAPVRCCWAGSMAALSVASFGYILLRLTEKVDDPTHLLVWHFSPILLIMMMGMIIGKTCLGRIWQLKA